MIRMSEQKDMSPDPSMPSGFKFSPIDLIFYLLSKWYWFVLSIAIFGGYAYYQYSKTPFYYSRATTVMIKSTNKQNIIRLDRLQNQSYTNVSNEILQFQSHKLMLEVVMRLNAHVSYTIKEKLREKELYTQSPVKVSFTEDNFPLLCSLQVTPLGPDKVRISHFNGMDGRYMDAPLGDTIASPIGRIIITPTLHYNEQWKNRSVQVRKGSINGMANYFRSNLRIKQAEDDAAILYLMLRDLSAIRAEDVLNTLVTVYNEENIKDKSEIAINTSKFINERLVIIEKELGGVESKIEAYKRENNMIDIGSAANMSISDKMQYRNEAEKLELQSRMSQYIKDYLTDPSKSTELIPSNTGVDINIESQIALYNANKLKRDKLIEGSSDKNPIVQELNKNLDAMRQNMIRAVDNAIVGLETKLEKAQSMQGQAQWRMANLPTQQRQMLTIERQQRIKEELYLYLLNKREENQLALATNETDARVLDPAGGSDSPVSPNGRSMVLKGIMKGTALPLVIFLAILFFDTRIRNRKDLEDVVTVPFLGEIPKDKNKQVQKVNGKEQLVIRTQGRDIVSEAFRIVRTNMDFMKVKSENMQVITFSSFGPGAGKTYVSTNLAASFAQTNKKVILVDLDIRKGTLSSRIHKQEKKGITTYLSGNVSLDEIIHPTDICENMDFIPAGPVAPNPSELLLSKRLEEMIAELRKRYDYIFIDNVPVGIIADATITNRIADLTVFVIRVGKIDRRMLPELEKIYRTGQLNNMSLILNGAIVKKSGYGGYGYGYGYGYSYGEETSFWKRIFKS